METRVIPPVELIMEFDPTTIEHLGIQMYSTLPPVISELVSNSYDADSETVDVHLIDDGDKKIIVEDKGHGMTFLDINDKFLKIGRNRRKATEGANLSVQMTESGNRYAIGKKGIGKLSFFGISKTAKIETIRDKKKNVFKLDWDILTASGKNYRPEIILKDEPTEELNGTRVTLSNIKRKSDFDPDNIAYNLAKTFSIFNEVNFKVRIIYNNKIEEAIEVKNELRFQNVEPEFEWNFPLDNDIIEYAYEYSGHITGKIISAKETVPSSIRGITLFSRGKLVNEPEFYDEKATSFGYSYLTGWLNVDFIDDWPKDVISTNRKSLNWEDEDSAKLRVYLLSVVKHIYKEQRKKRKEKQIKLISEVANINLDEWLQSAVLPEHEMKLAKKMIDSILASEGLPTDKQAELVKYVKDSFQFESFKQIAREFENTSELTTEKIIHLFKEWELIEAREMYKLATGRIQTIQTLDRLIDANAKEVEQMHPFFEKFPWILDPRINMFRHEVQYVKLLKEKFTDTQLEEKNRRIDFLCTSIANHRFVIELKRPQHQITLKDIDQAKDYRSFVEEHTDVNKFSPSRVISYVVGGKINYDDRKTRDEIDTIQNADKVYVKTYNQLLTDARNYHIEFIQRYEELEAKK
jgi:hypothetical protein